jgi:hypothetical protein
MIGKKRGGEGKGAPVIAKYNHAVGAKPLHVVSQPKVSLDRFSVDPGIDPSGFCWEISISKKVWASSPPAATY